MRIISSLERQVFLPVFVTLLFVLTSCKTPNKYWHEILTDQLSRDGNINPLDSSLCNFMIEYHVPALSATLSKDGKIVYSKTFGVSNLSTHEEANNKSLFRIAGLSTAITSLAIRKLVAQKRISY